MDLEIGTWGDPTVFTMFYFLSLEMDTWLFVYNSPSFEKKNLVVGCTKFYLFHSLYLQINSLYLAFPMHFFFLLLNPF